MGIDGYNRLTIRGSKEILDIIEQSGLILDNVDDKCTKIGKRFFGKENIKILDRIPTCLVVGYEFRNLPIYQYLEKMLTKYHTCWIKNTFSTENGYCGMWVGHYNGDKMYIQKLNWKEPSDEELYHMTDFSKLHNDIE